VSTSGTGTATVRQSGTGATTTTERRAQGSLLAPPTPFPPFRSRGRRWELANTCPDPRAMAAA
jgi:hypothetical protein